MYEQLVSGRHMEGDPGLGLVLNKEMLFLKPQNVVLRYY